MLHGCKIRIAGFLVEEGISPARYWRWLARKAATHCKRDRRRIANNSITIANYKQLIHNAVCKSGGFDWYTGEELQWDLLSKYNNEESKARKSIYKSEFALLPTVDHVFVTSGKYDFVICGLRTNDAKNDLNLEEFVALCRRVIARHGE